METNKTNNKIISGKKWEFITKFLPDYYHRDVAMESDILDRYISGEEVCSEDLKRINDEFKTMEDVEKYALDLNEKLYAEALQNFHRTQSLTLNTGSFRLIFDMIESVLSDSEYDPCSGMYVSGYKNLLSLNQSEYDMLRNIFIKIGEMMQ